MTVRPSKHPGTVTLEMHRFDEALWNFQQAIRVDPNFAEAHLNLGALLAATGNRDRAAAEIHEAVRLDPSLSKYADQALTPRAP